MNTIQEIKRIIIGENERAGLPISAPIADETETLPMLRWRRNEHSFSLEYWCTLTKKWREVPCVEYCPTESETGTVVPNREP